MAKLWNVVQMAAWMAAKEARIVQAVGNTIPDNSLDAANTALGVRGAVENRHWSLFACLETFARDAVRGGPVLYGRLWGRGETIEAIGPEYWPTRRVRDDARGIIFARDIADNAKWWDCLKVSADAVQSFYAVAYPEFDGPLVLHSIATPAALESSDAEPLPVPEPRKGARPKWLWEDARTAYAAHLAKDPNGLPEIQADAVNFVAQWFSSRHPSGEHPDKSDIRRKIVKPIYDEARKKG